MRSPSVEQVRGEPKARIEYSSGLARFGQPVGIALAVKQESVDRRYIYFYEYENNNKTLPKRTAKAINGLVWWPTPELYFICTTPTNLAARLHAKPPSFLLLPQAKRAAARLPTHAPDPAHCSDSTPTSVSLHRSARSARTIIIEQ